MAWVNSASSPGFSPYSSAVRVELWDWCIALLASYPWRPRTLFPRALWRIGACCPFLQKRTETERRIMIGILTFFGQSHINNTRSLSRRSVQLPPICSKLCWGLLEVPTDQSAGLSKVAGCRQKSPPSLLSRPATQLGCSLEEMVFSPTLAAYSNNTVGYFETLWQPWIITWFNMIFSDSQRFLTNKHDENIRHTWMVPPSCSRVFKSTEIVAAKNHNL